MQSDKDTIKKLKEIQNIQANPAWKERAWQTISGRIDRARVRPSNWFRRAVLVGSLAILLVVGSGGLVASAEDSLPGDVLYPVKRSAEKVHLLLIRQPEKRANLKALYDERRLRENERLMDRSKARQKP